MGVRMPLPPIDAGKAALLRSCAQRRRAPRCESCGLRGRPDSAHCVECGVPFLCCAHCGAPFDRELRS